MLVMQMPEHPLCDIEAAAPFAPRKIRAAFHDIDGTHSLIRKRVPVMTLVTGATARYGLHQGTPDELAEFLKALLTNLIVSDYRNIADKGIFK